MSLTVARRAIYLKRCVSLIAGRRPASNVSCFGSFFGSSWALWDPSRRRWAFGIWVSLARTRSLRDPWIQRPLTRDIRGVHCPSPAAGRRERSQRECTGVAVTAVQRRPGKTGRGRWRSLNRSALPQPPLYSQAAHSSDSISSRLAQIRYDRAISRSSRPVRGHRVMTCFDHVSYWFARPSSCRPPSKMPLLVIPREFCLPIARPRSRESDFRSSMSCRIGSAGQIPSTPFGDPESTSPMHSSPIELGPLLQHPPCRGDPLLENIVINCRVIIETGRAPPLAEDRESL